MIPTAAAAAANRSASAMPGREREPHAFGEGGRARRLRDGQAAEDARLDGGGRVRRQPVTGTWCWYVAARIVPRNVAPIAGPSLTAACTSAAPTPL